MPSSDRLDDLQQKFAENPRRYFAPLANELRKAGDARRAIALCREHLAHQPGHMSGHVVLAQAHHDAGELDEARRIFEHALQLDPENLIALRYMGDIARQHGAAADARSWYARILELDPRNPDAHARLADLDAAAEPPAQPAPSEAPPSGTVAPVAAAIGVAPVDEPLPMEFPEATALEPTPPTAGTGAEGADAEPPEPAAAPSVPELDAGDAMAPWGEPVFAYPPQGGQPEQLPPFADADSLVGDPEATLRELDAQFGAGDHAEELAADLAADALGAGSLEDAAVEEEFTAGFFAEVLHPETLAAGVHAERADEPWADEAQAAERPPAEATATGEQEAGAPPTPEQGAAEPLPEAQEPFAAAPAAELSVTGTPGAGEPGIEESPVEEPAAGELAAPEAASPAAWLEAEPSEQAGRSGEPVPAVGPEPAVEASTAETAQLLDADRSLAEQEPRELDEVIDVDRPLDVAPADAALLEEATSEPETSEPETGEPDAGESATNEPAAGEGLSGAAALVAQPWTEDDLAGRESVEAASMETTSLEPPSVEPSATAAGTVEGAPPDAAPVDHEPAASEPAAVEPWAHEPAEADWFAETAEYPAAAGVATGPAEPSPADPAEAGDEPSVWPEAEPRAASPAAEAAAADAFATATMAELYLRQGLNDQALAVYRQLAARQPDDAALQERVRRLEASLAGGAPVGDATGAAVRSPTPAATPAVGVTVRGWLRGLATAAAPPASSVAPPAASPGAAAPEAALTLDELLGRPVPAAEEHAAGALVSATLSLQEDAAVNAQLAEQTQDDPGSLDRLLRGTPSSVAALRQGVNFSFEQFFQQPAAPAPSGGEAPSGAGNAPADRGARPADDRDAIEADLEDFHAWLSGLSKS